MEGEYSPLQSMEAIATNQSAAELLQIQASQTTEGSLVGGQDPAYNPAPLPSAPAFCPLDPLDPPRLRLIRREP